MGERKKTRGLETKYYMPNPYEGGQIKLPELRGISLLCTAYKIFTTILRNKVESYAEKVTGEYRRVAGQDD
jgi:hypothetical protein